MDELWQMAPAPALCISTSTIVPPTWVANEAVGRWTAKHSLSGQDLAALVNELCADGGPAAGERMHKVGQGPLQVRSLAIPYRDGALVWLEADVPDIRDVLVASGQMPRDITSLQLREALRLSGATYGWINLKDQTIYHNETVLRLMLGREPNPGEGVTLEYTRSQIVPEDVAPALRDHEESIRTGRPIDTIIRYNYPKAGLRHFLITRAPIYDEHGDAVTLAMAGRDITDLMTARKESSRLRERLTSIADAVGLGLWSVDVGTGAVEWNAPMFRLHGRHPAEGVPSREEWLTRHVHPDDQSMVATAWETRRHKPGAKTQCEFRPSGLSPERDARWVLEQSHEEELDGRPVVLGVSIDISEQRRAEALLRDKLQAEEANRAKSQFLAQMSHELRTPLNAVLGYAQILQWDADLTSPQQVGLKTIEQSGQHLLGLIDEILDLARIEAGRIELHTAPVRLDTFLDDICRMVRLKIEQKGVAFVLDTDELPATILMDERRLRQILLNLLGNATRFTDHGEIRLRVRTIGRDQGGVTMRFEVKDTGTGISEPDQGKLFQPFQQAGDTKRRQGGTGLGLAISRQLVLHMGGEITLRSQLGQGSEFGFTLSFAQVDGELTQQVASVITGYEGRRRRILIVDDVRENREVLAHMLEPIGFETVQAEDGRDGVERALDALPDLVLMDNVMPVMDGVAATRSIRQHPLLKQTPVITLSANATVEAKAAALRAGASDVIVKPFKARELVSLIGHHLGLKFTTRGG